MSQITIVEAFADLEDCRRQAGTRHKQSLCLALFTLGVAAGNRGFIAIGDWIKAYSDELIELFNLEKKRLPSYSTIRRTLLRIDRQRYSACLSRFLGIDPIESETIVAVDGKVLLWYYEAINDNANVDSHPAINYGRQVTTS
ncbi:transposase family protein [Oscillatoria sp. HE19RPO]|uniref:transposase family protein n=1 Tax=Oscillatoria sp. HE19RPO TaxID=2954806 RepID=UPI0020C32F7B|nr:transposase family protein [Oscillatoria sp. HE19RPO]